MKRIQYSYAIPAILIFLAMVVVPGCMVGPNIAKPEMVTEEAFRFDSIAGDSMLNLKWWELFNDPYLDVMIETALTQNQDVLIAVSRIEQAYLVLGMSKADLYPSVGYEVSTAYGQPQPRGFSPDPGALFFITPNVYWELDFWGKIRRANEAARAEILASEEALRNVQIGLISAVADGYFQLLDYDMRLEISRRTWETRKESTYIIGERFYHGTIPEIDLNQAQLQEAEAAVAIPYYERLVARTEHFLSILTGTNPSAISRGKLTQQVVPPDVPVGLPSELLVRRPDLIQAEQLFYAETSRIGVAQAMRFPSFSITGVMGVASRDLTSLVSGDALAYFVGGSILGPIFNWGKNKRRVEIQKQVAEQASLRYEKAVLNAFREVEDALVDVLTYKREVESRKFQMKAATNAAKLSRARYDGGQTGYLEVLDTERWLFQTELNTSRTRREQLSAYTFLYKAIGGGWITVGDEPPLTE